MADAKTYVYEVYTTHLDTDQIAFKSAVGDSWQTPYQLEKK